MGLAFSIKFNSIQAGQWRWHTVAVHLMRHLVHRPRPGRGNQGSKLDDWCEFHVGDGFCVELVRVPYSVCQLVKQAESRWPIWDEQMP